MKCSLAAALSLVALSPHFLANSRGVRVGWATVLPSPALSWAEPLNAHGKYDDQPHDQRDQRSADSEAGAKLHAGPHREIDRGSVGAEHERYVEVLLRRRRRRLSAIRRRSRGGCVR